MDCHRVFFFYTQYLHLQRGWCWIDDSLSSVFTHIPLLRSRKKPALVRGGSASISSNVTFIRISVFPLRLSRVLDAPHKHTAGLNEKHFQWSNTYTVGQTGVREGGRNAYGGARACCHGNAGA